MAQSTYIERDSDFLPALLGKGKMPVRFYFDVGLFERDVARGFGAEFGRDLLTINRQLTSDLKAQGNSVVYREWAGPHCWLTWARSFDEALRVMFPAAKNGEE